MDEQLKIKRSRGRPATYASAVERAKAWRMRQKALIAQASASVPAAEPVVIEKIIEKPVFLPAEKSPRRSKPDAVASKLVPLIKQRLTGYGSEQRAKTLRANAARVSTTARELLDLLATDWRGSGIDAPEKAFLENVERFFLMLNSTFENAQLEAKAASAKQARQQQQRHEHELREMAVKTLGKTPTLELARALANDLLMFETAADAWLVKKLRVDRGRFHVNRSYEINKANRANDLAALLREIAEIRLEAGERGRQYTYQDEQCYAAGWAEFEQWRAEGKPLVGSGASEANGKH